MLFLKLIKVKNSILKLIVSGSHLSKKYGYTINEIFKGPITNNFKNSIKY